MMDWTDRHCRYFLRLIAPDVRLYTEMVTCGAILHGDRHRFLRFDPAEHPLALQLGGSDPAQLAACARIGADFGYDEINLNCGCPSDRVQSGRFGACLMAEPDLVAACVGAMAEAVKIPVTVKCRIGIDDRDDFDFLARFVDTVRQAGCSTFIIHARKAILKGLSPKENREIPPLDYSRARAIKDRFPDLEIVVNGGIGTIGQIEAHLEGLDGVMIGREAYQNPWFLSDIQRSFFKSPGIPDRHSAAEAMIPYIEARAVEGVPVKSVTRHMLGLFQGCPGARGWRRVLSTTAPLPGADSGIIRRALLEVSGLPGRKSA